MIETIDTIRNHSVRQHRGRITTHYTNNQRSVRIYIMDCWFGEPLLYEHM